MKVGVGIGEGVSLVFGMEVGVWNGGWWLEWRSVFGMEVGVDRTGS